MKEGDPLSSSDEDCQPFRFSEIHFRQEKPIPQIPLQHLNQPEEEKEEINKIPD